MQKKEKMQKYLQRDFELLCVVYLITGIIGALNFVDKLNYFVFYILIRSVIVIGLFVGSRDAKKGKLSAGIDGIVMAFLMLVSKDLLSILLGVFLCIHSIIYLINYKKFK